MRTITLKKLVKQFIRGITVSHIDINGVEMKTIIQIYKEGKYFVAVDIPTNVVDQGLTEEEAIKNLKKGLEEHYQILMELAHRGHKISFLDIEVENYAKASHPVS